MRFDPVHLAIMGLAIGVGVGVRRLVRVSVALPRNQAVGIGLAAVIGGAIGAKLPFLFDGLETLRSFDVWLSDNRTITWALFTGYLAVELTKLALGVTVKTGDGFAAPVAASVAVGRIGCFQGGCCYGLETVLPWGVDFGDGLLRHPTQLYEAGFHGLAAIGLLWMNRRGVLTSQHFKIYLGGYAAYRFVTEWLRPEPDWVGGLTFYQVTAVGIFATMLVLFGWDQRRVDRPPA